MTKVWYKKVYLDPNVFDGQFSLRGYMSNVVILLISLNAYGYGSENACKNVTNNNLL